MENPLSRQTLQPVGLEPTDARLQKGGSAQDRVDMNVLLLSLVPGGWCYAEMEARMCLITNEARLAVLSFIHFEITLQGYLKNHTATDFFSAYYMSNGTRGNPFNLKKNSGI